MIAQASRGAGKYEKPPIGVWPILEMPSHTSDGTGATYFLEDCGRIVGHSLADYRSYIGHILADFCILLLDRNRPENRQFKDRFC